MNVFWQAVLAEGWSHSLKQLQERRGAISVPAIAADWTAIAASTCAALHWGPWAVALALVVIGNHPRGPWSWLLHPHGNGMHLTHHLVPGVPHHALHAAHALLGNWLPYAQAEQCDGYFQGQRSVVASWRRNTVNDAHPSPMEVR